MKSRRTSMPHFFFLNKNSPKNKKNLFVPPRQCTSMYAFNAFWFPFLFNKYYQLIITSKHGQQLPICCSLTVKHLIREISRGHLSIFLHTTATQSHFGLSAPDLICTWKPCTWLKHCSEILDLIRNQSNQNSVNIRVKIPNTLGGRWGNEGSLKVRQ